MHVVVYEDRPHHLVGARLAVASLLREVSDAQVVLRCPRPHADLDAWCAQRPRVRLDTSPLAASGWDVKPSVLLEQLEHHEQVVWLDSDVVVWGGPRRAPATGTAGRPGRGR